MSPQRRPFGALPSLEGALPPQPGDLFRLHRLCLYIYGLLTRDIPAQAQALAAAAGSTIRKKHRQDLARTLGIKRVHVVDPRREGELERVLLECMESGELCVVISRSPCILAAKHIRQLEKSGN